ncbi:extracellular solute-binding protein [Paenibacillus sp. FSL H7-0714]|uniref:extracellular solute-binding protein n=1 Tax=Paenibacillus sp. FSL H7-0714 TaxID=2954735 RepID=UPI0030F5ADAD
MKKLKYSAIVAVVLSAALSITACSSANNSPTSTDGSSNNSPKVNNSSTAAPLPDITLTLRGSDSPVPGVQNNEIMNEIAKELGIKIDYSTRDATKDKVVLAGGDLPDIMQIDNVDLPTYIKGDHIIPLDDLLTEYGQDIAKNVPKMVSFSKQHLSADTGKLYGLTTNIEVNKTSSSPVYNYDIGPTLRWDYYKELGYPEITNDDQLLDILKQMQQKYPKTADGKPVYGISGWTDWGLWPYYVSYAFSHGYMDGVADAYLIDAKGNLQSNFTAEGGIFKDAMQFMNKAYNMGLVDPEMFTQKNTDFVAKVKNLQILSVQSTWWNGDAQKAMLAQGIKEGGYYQIPGLTPSVWEGYGSPILGGLSTRSFVISKNSKNPKRAMQFLNFLYSYKGSHLLNNGIEGKHWDLENGKPEFKDATLEAMKTDSTFRETSGIGLYANMIGLLGNDDSGNPLTLGSTDKAMKFNVSDADKDFNAHYGVDYPGQAFIKAQEAGKAKVEKFDTTWRDLMPEQPSDIKMIEGKISNYELPWVAKLILSKSDAEFEKMWTKGVEDMKAMGYDELMKWTIENNASAVQQVSEIN